MATDSHAAISLAGCTPGPTLVLPDPLVSIRVQNTGKFAVEIVDHAGRVVTVKPGAAWRIRVRKSCLAALEDRR